MTEQLLSYYDYTIPAIENALAAAESALELCDEGTVPYRKVAKAVKALQKALDNYED